LVPFTEAITSPPAAPTEPSRPSLAPTPALKLTGIGWQKDAAARFVVINGSAVGEGGSVDGAKVEEILPDKVRLKVDGKSVEIGLEK
jgi:type II secretory pathway component PulC